MEFIKFPLALYLAGAMITVTDDDQEYAAREAGYQDWQSDQEAMSAPQYGNDIAPTRDDLKALAKELGINHAHNITTANLADLVAAAQKAE